MAVGDLHGTVLHRRSTLAPVYQSMMPIRPQGGAYGGSGSAGRSIPNSGTRMIALGCVRDNASGHACRNKYSVSHFAAAVGDGMPGKSWMNLILLGLHDDHTI